MANLIDSLQKNSWLLFILLALALRLTSFFPYVIDHDESTYIIIADQLLQGKIPYVHNLDVKPLGIYLLFAFFLKIVHSVWMVRIGAAIAIGLTAYYLNKASMRFFGRTSGYQVGLLYIFLTSLHKWSWSANTEIFFLLFSVMGLYYFIIAEKSRDYLLIGLLFGVGLLFKYHILFDLFAFALFFILLRKSTFWTLSKKSILIVFGLMLPMIFVLVAYARMGYFNEILEATYEIPRRYASSFGLGNTFAFVGEFYLSIFPFSLLFFIGLYNAIKNKRKDIVILCSTWLFFTWLGILITGKNYFHYYFQALPCLCFFIPNFIRDLSHARIRSLLLLSLKQTAILIFAACLLTNLNQYLQLSKSPQYLNDVTNLIAGDLDDHEMIYTNHQNILYFLLNSDPPTKYTHTSLIYKSDLARAFGIDVDSEIKLIVSKRPKYFLFKGKPPEGFAVDVKTNYSLVRTFEKELNLYRRRGSQWLKD